MTPRKPKLVRRYYLRVRMTSAERDSLNAKRQDGESVSDVARRLLFSVPTPRGSRERP